MSCHPDPEIGRRLFLFLFSSFLSLSPSLSLCVSIGHDPPGRLNGVSRVFLRGSKEGETRGGGEAILLCCKK